MARRATRDSQKRETSAWGSPTRKWRMGKEQSWLNIQQELWLWTDGCWQDGALGQTLENSSAATKMRV